MIYRIYPSKDTTLYEDTSRKNQNTGKDEILEIGKFYDTDNTSLLGNSRALIQFNLNPISHSVVSGEITSPQYRLRAENIESREIQTSYDLYVYPIKESWTEGMGSEADTPHNLLDSTWVSRSLDSTWDTANATVDRPINPDLVASLQAYYDFAASIGSFELVEPIKGTRGDSPQLIVSDGKMAMSSSNYSGGTANLSASLESGSIYNIDFDFNKGTLSGVEFNVIDPSGFDLDSAVVGFQETLTTTATYNMAFTASVSGVYKLQFTFFDNNGNDGSLGTIDNFYLYRKVSETTLVLDQFASNLTSLPSTYLVNESIQNEDDEVATAVVSNYKLFLSSSLYGGATLNRKLTLQENRNYTASFDIDYGNYPLYNGVNTGSIEFTILSPDGKVVDSADISGYDRYISGSTSPTSTFQARQSGEYLLRWSFFGSGSAQYSASLDNVRINSSDHDTSGSVFTDIYYDANWITNEGGGTWYTASFHNGSHYKQSFDKYTSNLDVEVTEYVDEWLDSTRSNNGLIIKKSKVDEQSTKKFGSIKFFSSDTNTIYPPVLEARWDDSSFDTGSLDPLSGDDIILYVKNLATEYKETSKGKIRVFGRDRFPTRTFSTTSNYKLVKYLPTTSYYSVVDADTEQVIIPFDTNYTKLSCDSEGNYFNFWFNGLQPERFYKFVFRVDLNGTTKYYDDNFYFKVVR
ncbi:hypothetical protein N9W01_00070 [bacterium]|nr:hypothetical protein [bacterium]